jgi:seryl-tRNA synthetase
MEDLKEQMGEIGCDFCEKIYGEKCEHSKNEIRCRHTKWLTDKLTALFEKEIANEKILQDTLGEIYKQRDILATKLDKEQRENTNRIKALELQLAKRPMDNDMTVAYMKGVEDGKDKMKAQLAKVKEGLEKILNILTTFPFHSSDCVQVKDMVGIVKSIIKELSK